jgi:hypothetical protein
MYGWGDWISLAASGRVLASARGFFGSCLPDRDAVAGGCFSNDAGFIGEDVLVTEFRLSIEEETGADMKGTQRPAAKLAATFTVLAMAVGGCSSMSTLGGSTKTAANGLPSVQNCGVVGIGSPTKYACDGKVYTTFQLAGLQPIKK